MILAVKVLKAKFSEQEHFSQASGHNLHSRALGFSGRLIPEQGVFFLALGEQLLAHLIFAWSLTSVLPIM